jgi:hypothetical protein
MARPRKPANVLEFNGAFKKDPARRRKDAEGGGPFCPQLPAHLPQDVERAWYYLVARLPRVALYNSDEVAVEIAAKLLTAFWATNDLEVVKELRQWLGKLGMTPGDRTKIPAQAPTEEKDPYLD